MPLLYSRLFYHPAFSWFYFLSHSTNVSINQSFFWTSKNSPENDVCMGTDVFASIQCSDPGGPWSHTPLSKTIIRKFFQVPWVRFKHVIDTISTNGHDHFCAGLRKQTRRIQWKKWGIKRLNKFSKVTQLVSSLNSSSLASEPLLFTSMPYHLSLFLEKLSWEVTEVRDIYPFFVNCFLSHLLSYLILKTTLERKW